MKKQKKKTRFNKRLYIFMAFVTMVVVSFFAKPIKKGVNALHIRLKKGSQKATLRAQLKLNQQTLQPKPLHNFPRILSAAKRKNQRSH